MYKYYISVRIDLEMICLMSNEWIIIGIINEWMISIF